MSAVAIRPRGVDGRPGPTEVVRGPSSVAYVGGEPFPVPRELLRCVQLPLLPCRPLADVGRRAWLVRAVRGPCLHQMRDSMHSRTRDPGDSTPRPESPATRTARSAWRQCEATSDEREHAGATANWHSCAAACARTSVERCDARDDATDVAGRVVCRDSCAPLSVLLATATRYAYTVTVRPV
jgi:hypothetical protein